MSDIFLSVLNISLTEGWIILVVVLARTLLKKAPKWIICALWALVAVRLICPWSFESMFSLIPSSEPIPHDIAMNRTPAINSGITALNNVINPMLADSFTPDPVASANPLQILITILSVLWVVGIAILLVYALISYIKLKKTVGASISIDENVMACDEVKSPFILGVIKPLIYVPSTMNSATLDNVIKHERTHIKRGDHLWKPLGFILLAVYWFNPLCWLAYILLCRDIELACDEKVIRDMDDEGKAVYSEALLTCSFSRRKIAVCPLAFGEIGVKERVKTVLNYKKPAFWITCVSLIVCIVVAICFLTNPKEQVAANSESSDVVGLYTRTPDGKDAMIYKSGLYVSEDGSFTYSPSLISSYMGVGTWELDGENIIFTDTGMGDYRKEVFRYEKGHLYYVADKSASNSMWGLYDGAEYTISEEERVLDTIKEQSMPTDTGISDAETPQVDSIDKISEIQIQYINGENSESVGETIENTKYDFGDFYVEPRGYAFDGELLYYMYDIVNKGDTSAAVITPNHENSTVTYYVSNGYGPEKRLVMWAIIHFDKPYDSCELEISGKDSDNKYNCKLEVNVSEPFVPNASDDIPGTDSNSDTDFYY